MSSINPLTGEAADCITIAGPDGVNKVGPSKFSPQLPEELDVDPASPLKPKRPLRPPPPPDSSYETVSIQAPGKFSVIVEQKPFEVGSQSVRLRSRSCVKLRNDGILIKC